MVTILAPDAATDRTWTGRDDNQGHHHGLVPLEDSPVTILVLWKASKQGVAHFVGRYRIDLQELIRAGFAREVGGAAFLRFQSSGERIEIALNRSSRSLVVGGNPLVCGNAEKDKG